MVIPTIRLWARRAAWLALCAPLVLVGGCNRDADDHLDEAGDELEEAGEDIGDAAREAGKAVEEKVDDER